MRFSPLSNLSPRDDSAVQGMYQVMTLHFIDSGILTITLFSMHITTSNNLVMKTVINPHLPTLYVCSSKRDLVCRAVLECKIMIVVNVQDFGYTDLQQIVYEDDLCLDVPKGARKTKVDIQMCHYMGGNQKWNYSNTVSTLMMLVCAAVISQHIAGTLDILDILSPPPPIYTHTHTHRKNKNISLARSSGASIGTSV